MTITVCLYAKTLYYPTGGGHLWIYLNWALGLRALGCEEDAGELYSNDKRTGLLPFLDLPRRTTQPLELAILLGEYDQDERVMLLERGWRLRDAPEVAATPWDYQRYIQDSYGEFSCVKPSYIRLETAWISDRTLCYLASGKPATLMRRRSLDVYWSRYCSEKAESLFQSLIGI